MLPPVQPTSRSAVAFADSTAESAQLPNVPGTAGQDGGVRADQNNSSSIAGRINNLLLSSRETVRADMATIANMVGASIGIARKPNEADSAFAARFVAALTKLDEGQRAALQKQLNQVLKGLQVQVLLQVLQHQDGPEAALLSAYMEIQRSNRDNLKAQTVVSSYNQNSESEPEKPSEAQAANAGATPRATAPQTSITVALQGSVAGVVDKEAAIANLAATLRQASSGALTDYQTETGQVISVSPLPDGSTEAEAKALRTTPAPETNTGTSAKVLGAKIPNFGGLPASTGPQQDEQIQTAAAATPLKASATPPMDAPSARQSVAQTLTTPPAEPSSLKAKVADLSPSPLQQTEAEAAPRSTATVATPLAPAAKGPERPASQASARTQADVVDERALQKEAAMATALSMKGWSEAALFAPLTAQKESTSTGAELFRQMFFQTGDLNESAEASALRALANRPEAAQNAESAKPKTADSRDTETEKQATEHASVRAQAVLTLAGAQAVPVPAPSQILFPLAVPVPVVNYLANQQPPADERDISIDAIDALGDEETQQDARQQPNQDPPEEEEAETEALEAMDDDPLLLQATTDEAHDQTAYAELPRLPAPQDEPILADSLYWKIADLE
ncbi:hypothetical protein [Rhizobium oryziradicis]|uniref:Uncharacterized protein n=1 Tax=Rhizobium oryziradicis TaxID=1867956 RepID=A0A1Q8ZTC8_9HYPH|nr:hypothetical protein [Rhizobium oryziradicis]OLP45302.1 hypothetical protein BJF95_18520 [Rhizobium oryziradicis]